MGVIFSGVVLGIMVGVIAVRSVIWLCLDLFQLPFMAVTALFDASGIMLVALVAFHFSCAAGYRQQLRLACVYLIPLAVPAMLLRLSG